MQLLATNPRYIQSLREEVESIIGEEGWTKGSLTKMRRVDSFLKEAQRFQGNSFSRCNFSFCYEYLTKVRQWAFGARLWSISHSLMALSFRKELAWLSPHMLSIMTRKCTKILLLSIHSDSLTCEITWVKALNIRWHPQGPSWWRLDWDNQRGM